MSGTLGQLSIVWAYTFLSLVASSMQDKTKEYKMEQHCGDMLSMILEDSLQLVLTLDDYGSNQQVQTSRQCEILIESWYTWPKLMIYFNKLDLDCNDGYVAIYEGVSGVDPVKGVDKQICGETMPGGIYVTQSNLRLKYVTFNNSVNLDVFSVVITSFASNDQCPHGSFECNNMRCVDPAIRCNGYNTCGDHSGCRKDVSSVTIAGIAVGSIVGLCVLVGIAVAIGWHLYKARYKQQGQSGNQQSSVNGGNVPQRNPVGYSKFSNGDAKIPSTATPLTNTALPFCVTAGRKAAYPANWTGPGNQIHVYDNASFPAEPTEHTTEDDNTKETRNNNEREVVLKNSDNVSHGQVEKPSVRTVQPSPVLSVGKVSQGTSESELSTPDSDKGTLTTDVVSNESSNVTAVD